MATLMEMGLAPKIQQVLLIGQAELSNIQDSKGEFYYRFALKEPVIGFSSTQPELGSLGEFDEVYVRKNAFEAAGTGDETQGFTITGWVTDFSPSHRVLLYQETTSREFYKNQSKVDKAKNQASLLADVKERALLKAQKKA